MMDETSCPNCGNLYWCGCKPYENMLTEELIEHAMATVSLNGNSAMARQLVEIRHLPEQADG